MLSSFFPHLLFSFLPRWFGRDDACLLFGGVLYDDAGVSLRRTCGGARGVGCARPWVNPRGPSSSSSPRIAAAHLPAAAAATIIGASAPLLLSSPINTYIIRLGAGPPFVRTITSHPSHSFKLATSITYPARCIAYICTTPRFLFLRGRWPGCALIAPFPLTSHKQWKKAQNFMERKSSP